MTNELSLNTAKSAIQWYEEHIPIRGCSFSLDEIRQAYNEFSQLNQNFGRTVIANLPPQPELDPEAWEKEKLSLLEKAFRLTVTVHGEGDQRIYCENDSVFTSDDLPPTITRIYFTNLTAFRQNSNNTEPTNHLEVTFDFAKPTLFDSETLVSSATPNLSGVTVYARDH